MVTVLTRLLVLLVMCAAVTAEAQAPVDPKVEAEARALFEEGVKAADESRWADAASAFERSRARVERPSTLYNLLGALYRVGRYPEGLLVARDYLKLSDVQTDAASRAEAERLNADMKKAVARIQVSVDPARAIVEIDGERAVPTKPGNYQLTLNPGDYTLTASADGYDSHREPLKLTRGQNFRLRIAMRSLAPIKELPAPVANEGAAPRRSSSDALLEEGPGTDMLNRAMNRKRRRRIALWVVGGVLAAGVIAGSAVAAANQNP
jgi:hypothetical protein